MIQPYLPQLQLISLLTYWCAQTLPSDFSGNGNAASRTNTLNLLPQKYLRCGKKRWQRAEVSPEMSSSHRLADVKVLFWFKKFIAKAN